MNSNTAHPKREAHAVLDLPSRAWKAQKIERILNLQGRYEGCASSVKILDVGTGSGGIAHYFVNHASLKCQVDSVDTTDNRKILEGFSFTQVEDVRLPFPEASFDVVISNHVIEHVGKMSEQKQHLIELKRVLNAKGIIYLALPNRWMLIEPHYRLAFLSWLPVFLRSPYLRLMGKGDFYDCEPLSLRQLEHLLSEVGFCFHNASIEAMRLFFEIEKPDSIIGKMACRRSPIPQSFLCAIMPTLCYVLTKQD
ncbi:MAG: class I SAM-dependent methyltransferase [Betaproteobacteria bacterium]|nr:class I SAM-dependent methyltransferase [Betaproteobacteria bacterium]